MSINFCGGTPAAPIASISTAVIHGRGFGRSFGVPTINQAIEKSLTGMPDGLTYGVYFSRCRVGGKPDGEDGSNGGWYAAVSDVGVKPTVSGGGEPLCESFLLDYSGDLYGTDVTTELLYFRRREEKFDTFDALRRAIEEDIAAAREYFGL